MTTTLDFNATVGELVVEKPARARVFEKYGIDFCCGGKQRLADACTARGIDPRRIVAELTAPGEWTATAQPDWSAARLSDLADHIINTHHSYLRAEMPRIAALLEKVVNAHGQRHPELAECRAVYAGLRQELTSHMLKEEQVLFPMIRALEVATEPVAFHCGSVENPIRVMEHEHDDAGKALAQLRALTDGYTPPADACNTYRVVLDALETLERDMHLHVHKENNILFPRAARLEARLAGR